MSTKFITVSTEILHDKNLSANQKFIYSEICQLSQMDQGCFASNNHFSQLIGITKQGVSKAINDLIRKGYISSEIEKGTRNMVRIIKVLGINCGVGGINCGVGGINCGVESKENKTTNKQKTKENLFKCIFSDADTRDLIAYRKSIRKPIKTQMGMNSLVDRIKKVMDFYQVSFSQVFRVLEDKEWASIKVEWVKDEFASAKEVITYE